MFTKPIRGTETSTKHQVPNENKTHLPREHRSSSCPVLSSPKTGQARSLWPLWKRKVLALEDSNRAKVRSCSKVGRGLG